MDYHRALVICTFILAAVILYQQYRIEKLILIGNLKLKDYNRELDRYYHVAASSAAASAAPKS